MFLSLSELFAYSIRPFIIDDYSHFIVFWLGLLSVDYYVVMTLFSFIHRKKTHFMVIFVNLITECCWRCRHRCCWYLKNFRNAWIISTIFQFAFDCVPYRAHTHTIIIFTMYIYIVFVYNWIATIPNGFLTQMRNIYIINPKINKIITLSSE